MDDFDRYISRKGKGETVQVPESGFSEAEITTARSFVICKRGGTAGGPNNVWRRRFFPSRGPRPSSINFANVDWPPKSGLKRSNGTKGGKLA